MGFNDDKLGASVESAASLGAINTACGSTPPLLDLLLHEELVDGLLFPHELDNQSVQVDE